VLLVLLLLLLLLLLLRCLRPPGGGDGVGKFIVDWGVLLCKDLEYKNACILTLCSKSFVQPLIRSENMPSNQVLDDIKEKR